MQESAHRPVAFDPREIWATGPWSAGFQRRAVVPK